ncbi:MAG: hypothetical protein ABIF82_09035 [Planctomycetota bacterium]
MSEDASRPAIDGGTRLLVTAGAALGISSGVFLVTILQYAGMLPPFTPIPGCGRWYVEGYEPLVALVAAAGVWAFCPEQDIASGLLGAGSALAGMLLADAFRTLSSLPPPDWLEAPGRFVRLFVWGYWPKALRYAFGVYVAWYVCSRGRARSSKAGLAASGGEQE